MAKPINTTTAPTGQVPPFGLRMLPELKERIEASARDAGRSMNAEIVARLEASFLPPKIEQLEPLLLRLEGQLSQCERDLVEVAKLVGPVVLSAALNAKDDEPMPGDPSGRLAWAWRSLFKHLPPPEENRGSMDEAHQAVTWARLEMATMSAKREVIDREERRQFKRSLRKPEDYAP